MASTYTPLGVELQATGENAGTWGTKTNTNLQILEQISGGFTQQALTSGGTVNLSVSDGSTGAVLSHRMIEFTGSLSGNAVVTIPLDVQTFYFLRNSSSGSYTVQFKYVTGSGDSFTFAADDKGDQLVFAAANDSTNPDIITLAFGDGDVTTTGTQTLTNKTLTAPKIADAGFIADANGAEQIIFQTTSSAVNELEVTNAATGNPPILGASGETNVDVHIKPKGSGETRIGTGAAAATLTTSGAHDLVLDTNSGSNSGSITITDGANGDISVAPNGIGRVSLGAGAIQQLTEKITVSATAATGTINYDVITQAVLYFTSAASGNFTVNFRGDGSNTLNSIMDTGESLTTAFLVTNTGTPYYNNAVTIDGSSITPEWQGGSAPSAGNANSIDVYTYTIIKTADATFTALAAQTQFA